MTHLILFYECIKTAGEMDFLCLICAIYWSNGIQQTMTNYIFYLNLSNFSQKTAWFCSQFKKLTFSSYLPKVWVQIFLRDLFRNNVMLRNDKRNISIQALFSMTYFWNNSPSRRLTKLVANITEEWHLKKVKIHFELLPFTKVLHVNWKLR